MAYKSGPMTRARVRENCSSDGGPRQVWMVIFSLFVGPFFSCIAMGATRPASSLLPFIGPEGLA